MTDRNLLAASAWAAAALHARCLADLSAPALHVPWAVVFAVATAALAVLARILLGRYVRFIAYPA